MRELTRRRFAVPLWAPTQVGWWLLVLACVVGAVLTAVGLAPGFATYPGAAITAAVLSVPLLVAWWWLLRLPQLWQRIARSAAWAAIAWGGLAAVGLYALPGNGALLTAMGKTWGYQVAQEWGAAVVAPLTEEVGKALAIGIVVIAASQRLRTPMDAALVGAFAGVGFTATEDLLYAFNIAQFNLGENEVVSTMVIYLARAVIFSSASHVVFSAAVGAGLGWILVGRGGFRHVRGLAWITVGVGLHFLWNSPLAAPLWVRLAYMVAVPAIVWLLLADVRRAEHAWFVSTLAAPGVLGAVPASYVGTVKATWWKRRRYRETVRRAYGDAAVQAQREVEAAFTDLADAVDVGDDAEAGRIRAHLEARLVRSA